MKLTGTSQYVAYGAGAIPLIALATVGGVVWANASPSRHVQQTRDVMVVVARAVHADPPRMHRSLKGVDLGGVVPNDAWGTPLYYVSPGPQGEPFDLVSFGADGRPGGTGNDADLWWSQLR